MEAVNNESDVSTVKFHQKYLVAEKDERLLSRQPRCVLYTSRSMES